MHSLCRCGVKEKPGQHIAVEIEIFLRESFFSEFHIAIGQYMNYLAGLRRQEPERQLILAIPVKVYNQLRKNELFQYALADYHPNLLIFDSEYETVTAWIP